jgi:hypothetical protein
MNQGLAIRKFIIKTLLLFTGLGAVCTFLFIFFFPSHYTHMVPAIFGYFLVLNIIVFRALVKMQALSFAKFYRNFMVLTLVKLFGSFLVFAVTIYFNKQSAIPIIIVFFTLYATSLALEVIEINKYMRKITSK